MTCTNLCLISQTQILSGVGGHTQVTVKSKGVGVGGGHTPSIHYSYCEVHEVPRLYLTPETYFCCLYVRVKCTSLRLMSIQP